MTKKRQGSKIPVAQFVAIIALSISIFLIVDLGRRAAANYRVQREAYQLSQEVEAVRDYQTKLLARRTYVASDLFVEEVARNELKWAKPNEIVVAILPATTPDTSLHLEQPVPVAPRTSQTPAQAWWEMFFGEPPQSLLPAQASTGVQ